ncbi:MAG: hypothetical protein IT371_31885 [Deltaproteobacteria bacterium]|nr:hypothetical protein [Deltaproteobacteria bacterium]
MHTRSRSRSRRSRRWLWPAVIPAIAAVAGGLSRPTFATQDAAPSPVDAGPAVYDAPLPHVDRADARLADAAGPIYDAPLPHVEGAPPPSDGAAPTERGCACALAKNAPGGSRFSAIGVPLLLVLFAWRRRKEGRRPSCRSSALPLVAVLSVALAACGQPPASGAEPDSGYSATPPLVRTPEVGPAPAPGHDAGASTPLTDGRSPTPDDAARDGIGPADPTVPPPGTPTSPLPTGWVLPPYPHGDAAFRAELRALGLFDVTDPRYRGGADATGLKDSTDAIQEAMDDAYHAAERGGADRGVVFFPPGSYLVSRMLRGVSDRQQSRSNAHQLVGSSWGGGRPRIVLRDRAPRFGDPTSPYPVLNFYACNAEKETSSTCSPAYATQAASLEPSNGNKAMNMAQGVRNLEIVVGRGNPGAVGIWFSGAQDNVLQQVKVRFVEAGYAGLYGLVGTNAVVTNLEVEGGRFGLHGGLSEFPSFNNVVLKNQTEAAITSLKGAGPLALSGFEIVKAAPPAITDDVAGFSYYARSHSGGAYALSDGVIRFAQAGTRPAIENRDGRQVTLQNVYVENAQTLTQNGNGPRVVGGAGWARIELYGAIMPGGVGTHLLEGVLGGQDLAVPPQMGLAPPAGLRERHGVNMADFPTPDVLLQRVKTGDPSVAIVTRRGVRGVQTAAEATKPSAPDATATLQAILDDPQVRFVLLPRGIYLVSKTLVLREKTHLMGVANFLSELATHDTWTASAQKPATLLRTVDSATAETKLSFLKLRWHVGPERNWFTGVEWRAGRRSLYYNVITRGIATGTGEYGSPKPDHVIAGLGGGRFFGLSANSSGPSKHHPDHRNLLVEGTTEPLTLYGLNPEDGHGAFQVELRNARNVAIRGFKSEDRNSLLARGSRNLYALGIGGSNEWTVRDSSSVLGLNFASKFNDWPRSLLREEVAGKAAEVRADRALSVFRRGTVDLGVWP